MNILEKIIKKEFDIEPFEVVHLYWNFGIFSDKISGDFFFDENYQLKCIGLAGLVNVFDYVSHILTGQITVKKTHRMVSEGIMRLNVVPNKSEKIAIDYAKACNMNFLIKNNDGKTYATYEKPEKEGQAGWKINSDFIEIKIPISFLSCMDNEPYFIGNKK